MKPLLEVDAVSFAYGAVPAVYESATALWQCAADGGRPAVEQRAQFRSLVALVHRESGAIADESFRLGGSAVLYAGSTAQRRWRDIKTAGQHLIASPEIYRVLGALHTGAESAQFAAI